MPPEFRQPEYIHVLINHLPIYGLGTSALALLIGLLVRNRAVQMTGCFLVMLTALSFWPVAEYGQKGYDRVLAMSNKDAQQWLKLHADRADDAAWFFYTTAGFSAAGLVMLWKKFKGAFWAAALAFFLAVCSVGAGCWVAYAGGKSRHSEFRDGPPPVPISDSR